MALLALSNSLNFLVLFLLQKNSVPEAMIPGLFVVKEDNKIILQVPNRGQTAVCCNTSIIFFLYFNYLINILYFLTKSVHCEEKQEVKNSSKAGILWIYFQFTELALRSHGSGNGLPSSVLSLRSMLMQEIQLGKNADRHRWPQHFFL